MGDIFSANPTFDVLSKSLEGLSKRHDALANNIANVDTPNYKRRDVNFQETLERTIQNQSSTIPLRTTHPGHMSFSPSGEAQFSVSKAQDTSYRADQNNVDIEKELVEMNKNSLLYDSVTDFLNNEFTILRYAIEEGRR
jgi:flagellar basal-body rod protein FlgB